MLALLAWLCVHVGWQDRAGLKTPSLFFFFLEECRGSHIACITDEEGCLRIVSLSVCARSVGFYGRLDTAWHSRSSCQILGSQTIK